MECFREARFPEPGRIGFHKSASRKALENLYNMLDPLYRLLNLLANKQNRVDNGDGFLPGIPAG